MTALLVIITGLLVWTHASRPHRSGDKSVTRSRTP